jgi:DNA-binding Lrp family transcriptional regulator
VICRYVALLAPAALGFDMLCFLQVTLQRHGPAEVDAFRMAVRAMPEVLECHHVTGEYDYLLKVAIRNRQDLERFVVHRLTPAPGVARIHTSLVLSEIKNETALPVE